MSADPTNATRAASIGERSIPAASKTGSDMLRTTSSQRVTGRRSATKTTASQRASCGNTGSKAARWKITAAQRAATTGTEIPHSKSRNERGSFLGRLDSRGSPGTEAADVEMETPSGFARGIYARPEA